MKNLLAIIFLLYLVSNSVNARSFEIKVLNTSTINIGGKELKVGDKFDENAKIIWSSTKQAMKVVSDDNKVYILSHKLLSKHRAKSFADYITSVESATVRNDGENFPVSVEDHRTIFEGNFVMFDSITLEVGWRTNDCSYFVATTTNLGEQNFSFIIPAKDNVLTINRDVFSCLTSNYYEVILSISYIEKEYGETITITDSMTIEITPTCIISE